MKRHPLTSSSIALDNGRYAHVYHWRERPIRVIDDAENALLIIDLFTSQLLDAEEKLELLLQMLFVDSAAVVAAFGSDTPALVADMVWEVAGLDITGQHKAEYTEQPCFDWEQDAGRIRATLMSAYGIDWETAKTRLTYSQVCELLEMSPHESPFGQAVYYRTAKEPKPTKYNAEEIKHFRKAKAFYALKGSATPSSANAKSNDIFAMLARKAGGNG